MKSIVSKSVLVITVSALFVCRTPAAEAVGFRAAGVSMNSEVKNLRDMRNEGVVRQSTDFSCGAAGVATILTHGLHDPAPEQEVIQGLLQTTSLAKVKARKGFSLLDLKRYLEVRGYEAKGFKMDMEFLRQQELPVLVPITFKQYRHFVIVKKVIGDRVFVADPAMGNMIMKVNWFKRIWQNNVGLIVKEKVRNPFKPGWSDLDVETEDLVVANPATLRNAVAAHSIRTAVFPREFK